MFVCNFNLNFTRNEKSLKLPILGKFVEADGGILPVLSFNTSFLLIEVL